MRVGWGAAAFVPRGSRPPEAVSGVLGQGSSSMPLDGLWVRNGGYAPGSGRGLREETVFHLNGTRFPNSAQTGPAIRGSGFTRHTSGGVSVLGFAAWLAEYKRWFCNDIGVRNGCEPRFQAVSSIIRIVMRGSRNDETREDMIA